jgi:hypothetical protein
MLAVSTFYCLRRIWGTLFVFIRRSLRSERRTTSCRGHVRLSVRDLGAVTSSARRIFVEIGAATVVVNLRT